MTFISLGGLLHYLLYFILLGLIIIIKTWKNESIPFTNENSKQSTINIKLFILVLFLYLIWEILGYIIMPFRLDFILILTFNIFNTFIFYILYFAISLLHCTISNIKFKFISYKLFLSIIFKHLILIFLLIFLCLICEFISSYSILSSIINSVHNNFFIVEILMWIFCLIIIQICFIYSLKEINKFLLISFYRWIILFILRFGLFFICPADYNYLLTMSLLVVIFPDISEYIYLLLVKWLNLLDNIIPYPNMVYCLDENPRGLFSKKKFKEWAELEPYFNSVTFPDNIKELPMSKITFDSLITLYNKPTLHKEFKVLGLILIDRKAYIHQLNRIRYSVGPGSKTPIDILVPNKEDLHDTNNEDHFKVEVNGNKRWYKRINTSYNIPNEEHLHDPNNKDHIESVNENNEKVWYKRVKGSLYSIPNYHSNPMLKVEIKGKLVNYDPLNKSHNSKELWLVESEPKIFLGLTRPSLETERYRVHPSDHRYLKSKLKWVRGSTK